MTVTDRERAVVEALGLGPEELRRLADSMERGENPVTVGDVATLLLEQLPRHHRYEKSLRRLMRWDPDADARSVTASDVKAWSRRAGQEAMENPRARHGVGAEEAMVLAARSAFGLAVSDGLLRQNPASGTTMPSRPPNRRCALTPDQVEEVRLTLLAHSRDPSLDALVFDLLLETACRRAGAIRLAENDIGVETRTVRLVEKYGKQRWVPASGDLVERLLAHSDERHHGCDRVLHRKDGGHLTNRWFEGFARRMQALPWAGELGVSAHWLRHTTLTRIERVAGIRVAAAYAGHSDTSLGVTGVYTKPSLDELRQAHGAVFGDDDDFPSDHLIHQ